ncbi:hypothetical protein N7534_011691 [Penicillium rubens]|nr:hypothetical protein N7534_011691 [Penicillium rubens]
MPAIGPLRNGAARRKLRRGDRPPLGPGEIGPNNARNRAMKKRRREAQAAQAAPGGSPPHWDLEKSVRIMPATGP